MFGNSYGTGSNIAINSVPFNVASHSLEIRSGRGSRGRMLHCSELRIIVTESNVTSGPAVDWQRSGGAIDPSGCLSD